MAEMEKRRLGMVVSHPGSLVNILKALEEDATGES